MDRDTFQEMIENKGISDQWFFNLLFVCSCKIYYSSHTCLETPPIEIFILVECSLSGKFTCINECRIVQGYSPSVLKLLTKGFPETNLSFAN